MPIQKKIATDSDEFALGLAFQDTVLLTYTFWPEAVTLEGEPAPRLSSEQMIMFCDESPKQLLCTGRKIAKSVKIEATILRVAVNARDRGVVTEGMVTVPRQKDMDLLYGRVMARYHNDPLIMSMIAKDTRGSAPELWFRNNFVWYWRIEGMAGTDDNMRGLRCVYILGDEQQGSNWTCHNSRKLSALPGCRFLYAGVPDGRRSEPFYALDQTKLGTGWSKHKYSSRINPIFWNEEKWNELVADVGGINTQAYITLVEGKWGDEMVSSFPPGTIAVRPNLELYVREFGRDRIRPYAITGAYEVIFANIPRIKCHSFALGLDFGATSDPAVLVGAYRAKAESDWTQYLRFTFQSVEFPHLTGCMKWVIKNTFSGHMVGFCTDSIQMIEQLIADYGDDYRAQRAFKADPGGATTQYDENGREKRDADGKVLFVRNKQYYHEQLRLMMTTANLGLEGQKLWLGDDRDLIEELRGTTERKTEYYIVYESSEKSHGRNVDHRREALTYLAAAIIKGSILDSTYSSEDEVLAALGCVQGAPVWSPPWSVG